MAQIAHENQLQEDFLRGMLLVVVTVLLGVLALVGVSALGNVSGVSFSPELNRNLTVPASAAEAATPFGSAAKTAQLQGTAAGPRAGTSNQGAQLQGTQSGSGLQPAATL